MKMLSYLVAVTVAICGLVFIELPAAFAEASAPRASATAADITGTWELTIHYQPDDSDYLATYILKQEGEKITGTYHGMCGPADVTGTAKSDNVTLSVTVKGTTAQFSGKVASATQMSGTVTGTSDKPRKWSAEKKSDLSIAPDNANVVALGQHHVQTLGLTRPGRAGSP